MHPTLTPSLRPALSSPLSRSLPTAILAPHTVWRIPSGHPRFSPPGLLSRLLGRLRRARARWRRQAARFGVRRLDL